MWILKSRFAIFVNDHQICIVYTLDLELWKNVWEGVE